MSYVKSMGEVEAHFHMCEFISENDSQGITVVTCGITNIVIWGIVEENEKDAKECLVMGIQYVEIDAKSISRSFYLYYNHFLFY